MTKDTICDCGHTAGQHHTEGKHGCCESVMAGHMLERRWCACTAFVARDPQPVVPGFDPAASTRSRSVS